MTVDDFFAGQDESRQIFSALRLAVEAIGPATVTVSKSQVAFRRGTIFARVWMPEMYLRRKAAPLVLTLAIPRRDGSSRWKEVVEPAPGRFTHHLELYSPADIDEQVCHWLRDAWDAAA